jgi:hypothetical protein
MKNQRIIQIALILTPAVCTIMCGLVTVQTMWVYALGNLAQAMNQTRNQTRNQSLSPAIPGQQGGTSPG